MGSVIPSAQLLCSFCVKSTAYKNTSLSEASVWTFGVVVCRNCGTEGEGSAGCGIQRDPEGACWQLVGVPLGLGLGCKKCVVCCQPKKVNRFQYNISWQWPTLSEEARAQASKYVDAHRTQKCVYSNGRPFQKRHVLRQANTWMHTVHRNVGIAMADPFRRGTCSGKQVRGCIPYTEMCV